MDHLLGFSKVFKLLAQYKKPIVGHNVYLDLILLHNQFLGPLPNKYEEFKKNINSVFPNVYDTKYISLVMGKKLTLDEVWKSNALQDLYEFFQGGKCKKLERNINVVRLWTPFDRKQTYHEAGWDSYCTGYCLTRLGHWAACVHSGSSRAVGCAEMLAALQPYANKVNVIRGAEPYLNLSGEDPPGHRPNLVHVQSLRDGPINIGHVAALLARFGSIDVKPYGQRAALVAAHSQVTTEKIVKTFSNRDYKLSMYSAYRHSPKARLVMWSGALITGSLMILLLHKKIQS